MLDHSQTYKQAKFAHDLADLLGVQVRELDFDFASALYPILKNEFFELSSEDQAKCILSLQKDSEFKAALDRNWRLTCELLTQLSAVPQAMEEIGAAYKEFYRLNEFRKKLIPNPRIRGVMPIAQQQALVREAKSYNGQGVQETSSEKANLEKLKLLVEFTKKLATFLEAEINEIDWDFASTLYPILKNEFFELSPEEQKKYIRELKAHAGNPEEDPKILSAYSKFYRLNERKRKLIRDRDIHKVMSVLIGEAESYNGQGVQKSSLEKANLESPILLVEFTKKLAAFLEIKINEIDWDFASTLYPILKNEFFELSSKDKAKCILSLQKNPTFKAALDRNWRFTYALLDKVHANDAEEKRKILIAYSKFYRLNNLRQAMIPANQRKIMQMALQQALVLNIIKTDKAEAITAASTGGSHSRMQAKVTAPEIPAESEQELNEFKTKFAEFLYLPVTGEHCDPTFIAKLYAILGLTFFELEPQEQIFVLTNLKEEDAFKAALHQNWQLTCAFLDAVIRRKPDAKETITTTYGLFYFLGFCRGMVFNNQKSINASVTEQQAWTLRILRMNQEDKTAHSLEELAKHKMELLTCPISRQLFNTPVKIVEQQDDKECSFYFEKNNILEILESSSPINPITHKLITKEDMQEAPEKKEEVDAFLENLITNRQSVIDKQDRIAQHLNAIESMLGSLIKKANTDPSYRTVANKAISIYHFLESKQSLIYTHPVAFKEELLQLIEGTPLTMPQPAQNYWQEIENLARLILGIVVSGATLGVVNWTMGASPSTLFAAKKMPSPVDDELAPIKELKTYLRNPKGIE